MKNLNKRELDTILLYVKENLNPVPKIGCGGNKRTSLYFKTVRTNIVGKIYIWWLRKRYNFQLKGRGSRKYDGNQSNLSPYSPYCKNIDLYFRIKNDWHDKLGLVHSHYKTSRDYHSEMVNIGIKALKREGISLQCVRDSNNNLIDYKVVRN